MESLDPAHRYAKVCAGTPITVVLGEVKNQISPGNLAVEGSVVIEAMVPVHLEAEVSQVEFVRLRKIEYSQDRGDSLKCDRLAHRVSKFIQAYRLRRPRPNCSVDLRQVPSSVTAAVGTLAICQEEYPICSKDVVEMLDDVPQQDSAK